MAYRMPNCYKKVNNFCYICGNYMLDSKRKNITPNVHSLFQEYFKMKIGDQDKPWAPHVVCSTCVSTLNNWKKSNGKTQFDFAVPMYWMKVVDHSQCYFCQTNTTGFNKKNLKNIKYASFTSAKRPIPWNEGEERPIPTTSSGSSSESSENDPMNISTNTFDNVDGPMLFDQQSLNDLVRNCNLSKKTAEILAQTLSDRKLLAPGCSITFYRDRHQSYAQYFEEEDEITFCSDVE